MPIKYDENQGYLSDNGYYYDYFNFIKDGEKFEFMKTFRVFASKNPNDGGIYKRKIGKNPEKFANTPEHCFVLNSNIVGKKCSEFPDLDKVWYINLANKIIGDFYK